MTVRVKDGMSLDSKDIIAMAINEKFYFEAGKWRRGYHIVVVAKDGLHSIGYFDSEYKARGYLRYLQKKF